MKSNVRNAISGAERAEARNTSQDPDYVGPTFHEKRVHKDRFCTSVSYAKAWEAFERRRKDKIAKRNRKTGAGRGGKNAKNMETGT